MRRSAILALLVVTACSATSDTLIESVPSEAIAPEPATSVAVTSVAAVAEDLVAARDEGLAACSDYETVIDALMGNPATDLGSLVSQYERLNKASERLDVAIKRIEAIDPQVIPVEELKRWYSALQSGASGEVNDLGQLLLKFSEVFSIICDRIRVYR